ncbi:hypothetical protein GIB67_008921, partial [Kingdonia uniflora]
PNSKLPFSQKQNKTKPAISLHYLFLANRSFLRSSRSSPCISSPRRILLNRPPL